MRLRRECYLTIVQIASSILVLLIALLLFLQILGRYIFSYSFAWSEEIAGFLYVWLIFLGSSLSYKDKKFIKLEYLINKFSFRIKSAIKLLIDLIVLVGLFLLIIKGYEASIIASSRKTTFLLLSWKFVYLALPCGLSFLFFEYINSIYKNIFNFKKITQKRENISKQ